MRCVSLKSILYKPVEFWNDSLSHRWPLFSGFADRYTNVRRYAGVSIEMPIMTVRKKRNFFQALCCCLVYIYSSNCTHRSWGFV